MPPIEISIFICIVFFCAGWVKGIVGMGLGLIGVGALGLVMHPIKAAALMAAPLIITNIWQTWDGPNLLSIFRKLALMLACACVGTILGVQFLIAAKSTNWPSVTLGLVLAAYALVGLYLPHFTLASRTQTILAPFVGFITGVLSGATGIFAVPAVPYISALGFSKDELIQAIGLSFTVSTLALTLTLKTTGNFSNEMLLTSCLSVAPTFAGMYFGKNIRQRVNQAMFKKWFFVSMLLVGSYMVLTALLNASTQSPKQSNQIIQ